MKLLSRAQLQNAMATYFGRCDADEKPYTMAGLALYCGVSRQVLEHYQKDPEYSDLLDEAKTRIETQMLEKALTYKFHANFSQFILKNGYGYKDKSEQVIDQTVQAEVKLSFDDELRQAQEYFAEVDESN